MNNIFKKLSGLKAKFPNHFVAIRIVSIYILVGTLWIYYTDTFLGHTFKDPAIIILIAKIKGFLYIIVTASLLYVLIFRYLKRINNHYDALINSEKKYKIITDNTDDVIWIFDLAQHQFTYISPSVEKLRGFTVEEALKQPLTKVFTPDSYKVFISLLPLYNSKANRPEIDPLETRNELNQPCKNGSVVTTEVVIRTLNDSEGEPKEI